MIYNDNHDILRRQHTQQKRMRRLLVGLWKRLGAHGVQEVSPPFSALSQACFHGQKTKLPASAAKAASAASAAAAAGSCSVLRALWHLHHVWSSSEGLTDLNSSLRWRHWLIRLLFLPKIFPQTLYVAVAWLSDQWETPPVETRPHRSFRGIQRHADRPLHKEGDDKAETNEQASTLKKKVKDFGTAHVHGNTFLQSLVLAPSPSNSQIHSSMPLDILKSSGSGEHGKDVKIWKIANKHIILADGSPPSSVQRAFLGVGAPALPSPRQSEDCRWLFRY